MKETHIFIQARIRSSRLPGKILFNFFNETVIERIIRVSKKVLDKKYIHVLTGNKSNTDILHNICKKHKINKETEKYKFFNYKNVHVTLKFEIKPEIMEHLIEDKYGIRAYIYILFRKTFKNFKEVNFIFSARIKSVHPRSVEEYKNNLIQGVCEFWGNDSGPGHLAANLGIPTNICFRSTKSSIWRPTGPRVNIHEFDEDSI